MTSKSVFADLSRFYRPYVQLDGTIADKGPERGEGLYRSLRSCRHEAILHARFDNELAMRIEAHCFGVRRRAKVLTGVREHCFGRLMATVRASQHRLKLWFDHAPNVVWDRIAF